MAKARNDKNGRFYTRADGITVPSVTTVEALIAEPWMTAYQRKHARIALQKLIPELMSKAITGDIEGIDIPALLDTCLEAPDRHRDDAGSRGSFVHNAVEAWVKDWDQSFGEYISFLENYYPGMPIWKAQAIYDCLVKYQIIIHHAESAVYDAAVGGTIDLIGTIAGHRAIFDIKTGHLSLKALMQIAAYLDLWNANHPGEEATKRYIIHVPDGAKEAKLIDPDLHVDNQYRDLAAFNAIYHIYSYLTEDRKRLNKQDTIGTWCCKCGAFLGFRPGEGQSGDSHGFCGPCGKEEIAQVSNY